MLTEQQIEILKKILTESPPACDEIGYKLRGYNSVTPAVEKIVLEYNMPFGEVLGILHDFTHMNIYRHWIKKTKEPKNYEREIDKTKVLREELRGKCPTFYLDGLISMLKTLGKISKMRPTKQEAPTLAMFHDTLKFYSKKGKRRRTQFEINLYIHEFLEACFGIKNTINTCWSGCWI